jgi:hypothetical protein
MPTLNKASSGATNASSEKPASANQSRMCGVRSGTDADDAERRTRAPRQSVAHEALDDP